MIKRLSIICTILLLFMNVVPVYPVSVTAGLTTWYSVWWPEYEKSFRGSGNAVTESDPVNNSSAYDDNFSVDPCFMAGPVLGLRFTDRLSMGLVFLAGLEIDASSSFKVSGPVDTYTYRYDFTFRRYDGDLTLTYRLDGDVGIFGGVKYLRWDNAGTIDVSASPGPYTSSTEVDVTGQCLGPAAGVNISRPVMEVLFFTGSLSAMFLKSREDHSSSLSENGGPAVERVYEKHRSFLGINAMAGLGYYFSSISTTVILGGRVQYLKSNEDPRDIFGGITLSAMYSF